MEKDLSNKSILYAKDEPVARKIMSQILQKNFREIIVAENGKIAWDYFCIHTPDLIITDLAMPEMDGFELITRIQTKNPKLPIIVTTAYREETYALQDIPILFKPINIDILNQSIDQLLTNQPAKISD